MSTSSSESKPQPPPPHLHLHVGTTTSATAAATTTIGSAASPGSLSSSHHSSRAPRPTPTAGGVGSGQACAACKYQRRKCSRDCLLAPYFPADQPGRFVNAQRLFGVSNLTKTLKRVGPKYADDAMRAVIYQADARAADPVGGCVGIIEELGRQIHNTETELQFVRQQIAICSQQASATDGGGLSGPAAAAMNLPAAAFPVVAGGHQDGMIASMDGIYAGQQPSIPAGHLPNDAWSHSHQQQLYDYFCNNNGTSSGDEATSDDEGMRQSGFADVVEDSSVAKAGSPAMALGEQLGQHCQIEASPFLDTFGAKPQVLPPATMQHNGPAVAAFDVMHSEQKKLVTPVLMKHNEDALDEDMEDLQATAGAPCHLKLGFSSFSNA